MRVTSARRRGDTARVPFPDGDTFIARYRPPAPHLVASGRGFGADLALFHCIASFTNTTASPIAWLLCRLGCGQKTLANQRVALENRIHAWHAGQGDPQAYGPPSAPPPPISADPVLILRENVAVARSFLECQNNMIKDFPQTD